jgi:hypothetical protein
MNHTTLGLVAVVIATTLVITSLAAAPAFAGGHYKRGLGDGNTLTKEENQGKATASGFGTVAANVQLNSICFDVAACV